MKRLLIEFLGTFFLILAVALTANPLAIATMLMAWLYIGGYISGGHYNPLVSLAVAIRGRLSWELFPRYVIAQILGGFVAFATTYHLTSNIIVPAPGVGVTLLQAFVVEILLAFVFALVVLTVATSDKYAGSHIFGFAIGFTVIALAVVGGPISGGLFNPAIAVGSVLFAAIKGAAVVWENLAMYVGGALLGGAAAAYAFRYFGLDGSKK